jgi:hypothetical protein
MKKTYGGKKGIVQNVRTKASESMLSQIWTDEEIGKLAFEEVPTAVVKVEDMEAKIDRGKNKKK